jgi:DNA-binding LytR/AlgR family response regulator
MATEALAFLSKQSVDLIFLDIRMPKLSGLDFLRTLQQRPLVIITSAYEEHALESFDLEVCDYLLKPFRFDRFLKAANRALAIHTLKKQAADIPVAVTPSPVIAEPAQVYIKSDKKLVQLLLDEIYYLESLGNYVKVWQEQKYLLTPRTLSSFETQLPPDSFIRIHKSYILNKKFVHYIEGNIIRLKNGKELPLGKNYKHVVKQLLNV